MKHDVEDGYNLYETATYANVFCLKTIKNHGWIDGDEILKQNDDCD